MSTLQSLDVVIVFLGGLHNYGMELDYLYGNTLLTDAEIIAMYPNDTVLHIVRN